MENASVVLYAWGPHRSTFDTRVAILPLAALTLTVAPERVRHVGMRSGSMVLAILLTPAELREVEKAHQFLLVGDILTHSDLDWGTVGMTMTAILQNQVEPLLSNKKSRRKR